MRYDNNMVPYFPLTRDTFEMTMNAQPNAGALIQVEPDLYPAQLALKDSILGSDYGYYYHCPEEVLPLVWETLELVLTNMATHLPERFALETQGDRWTWVNRLLNSTTCFIFGDAATLPLPPLDWLGRQVQEDLILMSERADGDTVCVAGHLCFGSVWSLGEKIGQTFLEIHDPVPTFREGVGRSADLLMRRLKAGRPVSRLNWSVTSTDRLNLAPALAPEWISSRFEITSENAGEKVHFRIEYQTLTRLPRTGGILFTIHTYVNPLQEIVADADRLRRLTAVMRDFPEAMKRYKGMEPYYPALMAYLERCLEGLSTG